MKKLNIQRPGEAPTNGEPAYGDNSPFLARGNRQRALNALFSTLHSNGSSPTLRSMKIIAARSIADARRLSETFDESRAVV
jgi:hypothetical protein